MDFLIEKFKNLKKEKSSSESNIKIDDLSFDHLIKILESLNIHDIRRCRLVNRKFLEVTNKIEITELILRPKKMKCKWSDDESRPLVNVIKMKDNDLLYYYNKLTSNYNLKNLKMLKINLIIYQNEFRINHLNNFTSLENLQLEGFEGSNFNFKIINEKINKNGTQNEKEEAVNENNNGEMNNEILSLPVLQTLCINLIYGNLFVNFPVLQTLYGTISCAKKLKFKEEPNSVKHFILEDLGHLEQNDQIPFRKLEIITIRNLKVNLKGGRTLDSNFIENLPELKTMKISFKKWTSAGEKIAFFTELIRQKVWSNRNELQIFYKDRIIEEKKSHLNGRRSRIYSSSNDGISDYGIGLAYLDSQTSTNYYWNSSNYFWDNICNSGGYYWDGADCGADYGGSDFGDCGAGDCGF